MSSIHDMIALVQESANTPLTEEQIRQAFEALDKAHAETQWAIEDEAERNELEELVVLTAAMKYLEADDKVNTAAYERLEAKFEASKNALAAAPSKVVGENT